MDYFLLKQDERYINTPQLIGVFKDINKKHINLLDAHKIQDIIVFNVKTDLSTEYLDILDTQLFLISSDMEMIMSKFNQNVIYKKIALIDHIQKRQGNYSMPIFEKIEALSEESEFNLDRTVVKKIVLDKDKINGIKIFQIKESSKTLIVIRLDVAESLLRRHFRGIKLERLEVK